MRAEKFLQTVGLNRNNPEHEQLLKDDISQLRKIKSENMSIIRTPFFGVAFDANDLGIFAGITFIVVL